MKKLALLVFLSVLSLHSKAQYINWSSPVSVAAGSTYGNIYPRIALTENDNPIVIWGNGVADKIYSAKWNGSDFDMPVTLNPIGLTPFVATWAGAEIASSGDTVFVTFSTDLSEEGKIYTVRSLNGGLSFEDTVRVDQIGINVPRFPTVAVGTGGNPVVAFMQLDENFLNGEYTVARSMNGGTSYMPSIVASLGVAGEVCDCCPAKIVTEGNRHVLTYRNNENNIRNMWASFSTDGSASYPVSSEIDPTDWMVMSCPSSGPSNMIAGDSLISTWMSDGKVYLGTTNLTDQQNGIQKELFPGSSGTQNYPVIAGKGDTMAVVWQGYAGPQEVFFSYSFTGAAGLGLTIDTLTADITGSQLRPDLKYANGKFYLVYSHGQDVKYMTAEIGNAAGQSENANSPALTMYTTELNGAAQIKVKSPVQSAASVRIFNALGESIMRVHIQLNSGVNTIAVPAGIKKGIYFVELQTSDGAVYTAKALF